MAKLDTYTLDSFVGEQIRRLTAQGEKNYYIEDYYGKSFDGNDVSTAINAAVADARAWLQAGNYRSARIIFPVGQRATCSSTLNFTGFTNSSNSLFVDWNGTSLFCNTNGTPVIDALGSGAIIWNKVRLAGVAPAPNIGILTGRINTTALDGGGARMIFNDCRITDAFTLAAHYSFSGESCTYEGCNFSNSTASSSAYSVILDGINHFGVTSAFVTQSAPADSPQSFNQNVFRRCTFAAGAASNRGVIWRSAARQHEFQNCYFICGTNNYAIEEYCATGSDGTSESCIHDIHVEGTSLGYFLFDGNTVSPTVAGWRVIAPYLFPTTAAFAIKSGSTVTSVTLRNLDFEKTGGINASGASTFKIFSDATKFSVSGRVTLNDGKFWNMPTTSNVLMQFGMRRPSVAVGPVDILGTASWAYSTFRLLNLNYSGPIIRLRNGTTAAEADFYAGANGVIDLSAVSAFAAGATLYLVTAYDQSGNGNNRTQSNTARQAEYVLSVAALGNKPGALFTAGGAQGYVTTAATAVNDLWSAGGYLSLVMNQIGSPGTTARLFDKAQWSWYYTGATTEHQFNRGASTTAGAWVAPAISNGGRLIDVLYSQTSVANDPTIAIEATNQVFTSDTNPVGSFTADTADLYFFNRSLYDRAPSAHWAEDYAVKSTPTANQLAAVRRNQAAFYGLTVVA